MYLNVDVRQLRVILHCLPENEKTGKLEFKRRNGFSQKSFVPRVQRLNHVIDKLTS